MTNGRRGVAARRVSRGPSHALALVAVLLTLAGGDLGLAGLTDEGDDGPLCCLHLVNFSYAFGNGR